MERWLALGARVLTFLLGEEGQNIYCTFLSHWVLTVKKRMGDPAVVMPETEGHSMDNFFPKRDQKKEQSNQEANEASRVGRSSHLEGLRLGDGGSLGDGAMSDDGGP